MTPSLHLLGGDRPPQGAAPLTITRVGDDSGGGRVLACKRCGHALTRTGHRISVGGAHEHMRPNPHGYVHRFGCFAAAPGCVSEGVPSKQFTWFAGYFWHRQACGACAEFVGWLFFTDGSSFYGLLLDALVEVDENPAGS